MSVQGVLSWGLCWRRDGWSAGFSLGDTHVSISVGLSFLGGTSSSPLAGNVTLVLEFWSWEGAEGCLSPLSVCTPSLNSPLCILALPLPPAPMAWQLSWFKVLHSWGLG